MANTTKIAALVVDIDGDISKLRTEMRAAPGVVKSATDDIQTRLSAMKGGFDTATSSAASLASMSHVLSSALAGLGIGVGLASTIQLSDEYTKFTAQLKLATQSAREYAQAYTDVKHIANSAQADLAATGVLYARIANGTRELGISQKKVADITETVNLALKVSGATAQESASAMLQLSQSFASSTLRGEEFNAVNEAAPRLMLALADGIGVPVGALKKMASDGLITSQVMADTLPKALEKLQDEAKSVQTISGAFTVLKNNVMEFTGVQENANGTVSLLVNGINFLSNNLTALMGVLSTITAVKIGTYFADFAIKAYTSAEANAAVRASALATAQAEVASTTAKVASIAATEAMIVVAREEAIAKLASSNASLFAAKAHLEAAAAAGYQSFAMREQVNASNALNAAQARHSAMLAELAILGRQQASVTAQAAAASGAHTAALAAQSAGMGGAAVGAGLLRGALAFLGGPIGAIITGLGLAATAWSVWGDKAKEANDKALASTVETSDEMIARLDKEINKLRERNKLAGQLPEIKGASEVNKDGLARAKKEFEDAQNSSGKYAGLNESARLEVLTVTGKKYGELYAQLAEMNKEQQKAAGITDKSKAAEWADKYASKLQQMNKELAEYTKESGSAFDPKIAAAIREKYAEQDKGASVTKKEASAYQSLISSIDEKIAASKLEMLGYDQLSESQKLTIKLDQEIATHKKLITPLHIKEAQAKIEILKANEAIISSDKLARQSVDDTNRDVAAIYAQVAAAELNVKTYGMLPSAITAAAIADAEAQKVAVASFDQDGLFTKGINAKIDALRKLSAVQATSQAQDAGTDVVKAKLMLDIMTELDNVTKSAAAGMAASFGKIGTAIGGMTTALTGYSRAQAAIAAQLAASTKDASGDPTKLFKARATAAEQTAQAQISSYAGMTSAAKGFFDTNSTGYRALEGAEKAFRAVEMAMAVESMLTKSGLLAGFTGLFVASKATETAATVASVAPDIAASMAKGTVAAAVGVASQAQGDPYTAWPRMAAMVAAMAALGFAVSGGGGSGVDVAKERQAAAGTGTVLGDAAAKSDSIAKSLEYMSKNSDIGLSHTAGMLAALRNIESSVAGLGNLLVRNSGLTGSLPQTSKGAAESFGNSTKGVALTGGPIGLVLDKITGGLIGKWTGSILGSIFGGKTTALDTGITAGKASLGNIANKGISASQYTDTKTDGGWFHSDSYGTQVKALGAEANDQLSKVIKGIASGVTEAGKLLGVGGDAFNQQLQGFVVDIGKVSLKGLTGEQIQKQLETTFSALGDNMARYALPALDTFQHVGEGYFQTLMRIATDYANVDSVLKSAGMVFGAVGLSSIGARERLIELAGGMGKLASGTKFFTDTYLTEAERMAPIAQDVSEKMAAMGLAGVTTREQFKDAVLGLSKSGALATEAGAATYAGLMNVQEAFALLHPELDKTANSAKSAADILSERRSLQDQYDNLTMTSVQLLDKQRNALDGSNRALFDQVQAVTVAKKAQEDLASATAAMAQRVSGAMSNFADARTNLEAQLMTEKGDVAGASALTRKAELAKLTDGMSVADAAKLTAGYDYNESLKAQIKTLQESKAAAIALAQAATQAAEQAAQAAKQFTAAWQPVTDSILGEVSRLRGVTIGTGREGFVASQAKFAITTAQARAGDQDAAKLLTPLSVALDKFAEHSFSTLKELNNFRALTAASLAETANGFTKYGVKIPGFVNGGDFAGGLRLVGEHGPEIEATGASRIFNASQTRSMLGGSNDALVNSLIKEVSELKKAIERLATPIIETEKHTRKVKENIQRVTLDGEGMRSERAPA